MSVSPTTHLSRNALPIYAVVSLVVCVLHMGLCEQWMNVSLNGHMPALGSSAVEQGAM